MHPGHWGTPHHGPMGAPPDTSAYFSGAELSALEAPGPEWQSDSSMNAERHGRARGGAVPPLHLPNTRSGSYELAADAHRRPARGSPATITSEHCREAMPLTARRVPPPSEGVRAQGPRSLASGAGGRAQRAWSGGAEVDPAAASVLCSSVLSAASDGAAHSPRSASGVSASGVSVSAFSAAGGGQLQTGGSSSSAVDGSAKRWVGGRESKGGSPGRVIGTSHSPLTQPTEEEE